MGRRPEYEELVRSWMRTYDGLFKVPIIGEPSFDGTRDTSATFQAEVDEVIDDLIRDLGIPCHRLDASDRDGWVDAVMRAMGLPLQPPQMDIFTGSA